MGPRASLDVVGKRKIPASARNENLVLQPIVAILTELVKEIN
jgi:hypothetical protein